MPSEFLEDTNPAGGLTVAELIARLSQFDGTIPLMLRGRDGGFAPLCDVHETPVALNVNSDPAFGPHDVPWETRSADLSALVLLPGQWLGP